MVSISERTAEYSVLFLTSQRRLSALERLAVVTSRSFSLLRRSFLVASAFCLIRSSDDLASARAAWMASICLGSRAASASSAAIRVSKPCKSISVRSCGSTPSLIVAESWAHLDSNQDLTGYEPAALPLSYGPAGSSWSSLDSRSRFQEAPELLGARRMSELAERLGLDLADTFPCHGKILSDFFKGVLTTVGQAEAQPQHLLLARRERVQHLVGLLAQGETDDRLDRRDDLLVLDEITQMTVLFLSDRRLQRDRLLRDLQDLAHLVDRHLHLGRDLFWSRLAAELLHELAGGPDKLVDGLDHVHGDADGARLVGDRAGDRLADPPGRVRRELVAAAVLELVDGLHQADVAFLDQIEELKPPVRVLLRDRDDQPEIGLDHLLLGLRGLDLARLDDGHDALDLVGLGVGAALGDLDLLLGDPYLLLLGRRELLGGLEMQIADPARGGGAAVGGRVAERDVDEVLHLVGRRAPAVGPEPNHTLGPLDVVEQVAQPLHQAAAAQLGILAVDDLVADVERPELLEHLGLALLGLRLEALPRRLLALLGLAPADRLAPELLGLDDQLVALAEQPVDHRERGDDHARQLRFLFLSEFFLVDVHDFLDGDVVAA